MASTWQRFQLDQRPLSPTLQVDWYYWHAAVTTVSAWNPVLVPSDFDTCQLSYSRIRVLLQITSRHWFGVKHAQPCPSSFWQSTNHAVILTSSSGRCCSTSLASCSSVALFSMLSAIDLSINLLYLLKKTYNKPQLLTKSDIICTSSSGRPCITSLASYSSVALFSVLSAIDLSINLLYLLTTQMYNKPQPSMESDIIRTSSSGRPCITSLASSSSAALFSMFSAIDLSTGSMRRSCISSMEIEYARAREWPLCIAGNQQPHSMHSFDLSARPEPSIDTHVHCTHSRMGHWRIRSTQLADQGQHGCGQSNHTSSLQRILVYCPATNSRLLYVDDLRFYIRPSNSRDHFTDVLLSKSLNILKGC